MARGRGVPKHGPASAPPPMSTDFSSPKFENRVLDPVGRVGGELRGPSAGIYRGPGLAVGQNEPGPSAAPEIR